MGEGASPASEAVAGRWAFYLAGTVAGVASRATRARKTMKPRSDAPPVTAQRAAPRYSLDARLARFTFSFARTTTVRAIDAFCRFVHFCNPVADRIGAGALRSSAPQSRSVLVSDRYCKYRQHARWRSRLVDGLRRAQSGRSICAFKPSHARDRLAGTARAKSLFAGLASLGGRSALCRSRLASASVLALPCLYGDRQVPKIRDHDDHLGKSFLGPT
jgi:hypothetical protein